MDFQFNSYRDALKLFGYSLTKETFNLYAGMGGREILTALLGDNELVEKVYAVKKEIHSRSTNDAAPVENVIKLFRMFEGKYIVAIVSCGNKSIIEKAMIKYFLHPNYIFTLDDYTGPAKPDPGIYRYAMGEIGVVPSECFGFEDSIYGIRALVSAGIDYINVKEFYE